MVTVCPYFHVHQPYRLRDYHVFDIGDDDYFDEETNKHIIQRAADDCYKPMNELLLRLIERHPDRFNASFSITGTAIEQLRRHAPDALASFKRLADTGNVEILGETYYHSLACTTNDDEFDTQVARHEELIEDTFGQTPTAFRNTELIFSNEIAKKAQDRGYEVILGEGSDHLLGDRHPNHVYGTTYTDDIDVLLRNYELSDDIAFRFSNEDWDHYPLHADEYAEWVDAVNGGGEVVNLFMDYETFGEHQWASTGIFEFFEAMVDNVLDNDDNRFATVTDAARSHEQRGEVDAHHYSSWADARRDLGAWLGNDLQRQAHDELYELRDAIFDSGDDALIESWRRLTTSDHVYYMYNDGMSDGDVHEHFSPYDSPYDAYMYYMNVLNDVARRIAEEDTTITESPSKLLNTVHERGGTP